MTVFLVPQEFIMHHISSTQSFSSYLIQDPTETTKAVAMVTSSGQHD